MLVTSVNVVQSVLNNSTLDTHSARCPLTVFTGMHQDTPMICIKYKARDVAKVVSLDEIRATQLVQVGIIHSLMNEMRCEVKELF